MRLILFLIFTFLSQFFLYGDYPIILLVAHSRSCSTVLERCMHERNDTITMHEPFSYLYFQNRDGKNHDSLKLFKGECYTPSYKELVSKINFLSKSSPVFIKDLGIGCEPLFNDRDFLEKKNLFFIFLVRHPSTTLLSLFKLDPNYPDACNEYCALYQRFKVLDKKKNILLISSEEFCKTPEEYLQDIAHWVGLKTIKGTSKFKKDPPESWRKHTHWCKKAISSSSIDSTNSSYFMSCPTFSDQKELNDRWTEAYEKSILYYQKLIDNL